MTYAPPQHWDRYFGELHQAGDDLDWGQQWTGPFIEVLHQANVRTILDLGCGAGNEVRTLTDAGFFLTGLDYSRQGLHRAQTKAATNAAFVLADMACSLPFATATFDAVMSNVALHMFCDALTRALFAEVRRVVRPQGLFLFHVNALEDRPFRAERTRRCKRSNQTTFWRIQVKRCTSSQRPTCWSCWPIGRRSLWKPSLSGIKKPESRSNRYGAELDGGNGATGGRIRRLFPEDHPAKPSLA